jgi:hypothetical protein
MMVYSLWIPLSRLVQRAYRLPRTLSGMGLQQIKWTVAAVWVLAATIVGLVGGVTSPGSLVVLAALGLLPPLALLLLWNHPAQSMSESIQQGRR